MMTIGKGFDGYGESAYGEFYYVWKCALRGSSDGIMIKSTLVVWKECSRWYELRPSMTKSFLGCSVPSLCQWCFMVL